MLVVNISEAEREALLRAVTPSQADVMRAKLLVMARLDEKQTVTTSELIDILNDDAGIPNVQGRYERIRIPVSGEEWQPDPDAYPIARQRNHMAARVALDDLIRRGVVAGRKEGVVVFPISRGNVSGDVRIGVEEPAVTEKRIALNEQMPGIGDVDLFTMDLRVLRLDPRTRRCLEEALTAHRHGLYLSAASLLGAVSEGAWYAAGEQLRSHDSRLAKALDQDQTAKVINLVCELMHRVGRLKAAANELQAFAGYLRDLRNYGIHPREAIDTSKEPAFTESATMCLILQTHRYLEQLADAVTTLGEGD